MIALHTKRRVYLVDDDADFRAATRRHLTALGFEVQVYASAEEFRATFDPEAEGCLLLDLRMTGQSGLEMMQAVKQRLAEGEVMPPVVFLTGHGDVPTSVLAMRRGAVDFLQKPVAEEQLLAALQRALDQDALQRQERAETLELRVRLATLTKREREVLHEMLSGALNKQAAQNLHIAERTVKLHRANVLLKMGAGSIAELVRMAERLGVRPNGG
jgi:FixJ family two-component response regulator